MTTLLMSLIAAALLLMAALYWRQIQDDEVSERQREDDRVSPLLRGINYLLSDEPDLALQEMVQVARLRSEAADVYMALGEMFRAKGEIGRAVRIHQNILARPDVAKDLYLQAHLALGKDFQAGGLLDRALRQYEKALTLQSDHVGALEASLRIRELSSEWTEAEELLSRLEQIQGDSLHLHRAYLLAEMAAAHVTDHPDKAMRNAGKALALDRACAHAHIVLITLYLNQGDFSRAKEALQQMWDAAAEHVHLLVPAILANPEFYQKYGYQELIRFWQDGKDEELALTWLESVKSSEELLKLKEDLGIVPSTLRTSLRLSAIESSECESLSSHAARWRARMKRFACHECGVKVVELRWQCPQCHTWGSMHAIREEGV
ncbi:MAG: heat-shock protein [Mariprofundaceae bacterium]|nr:heat-shock protein [Mariprofundaceae bacterium]